MTPKLSHHVIILTHCLNHLHLLYHSFRRLKSSKARINQQQIYLRGVNLSFLFEVFQLPKTQDIYQPETMTRRFSCSMAASADACSVSPIPLSCSSRASAGFHMIDIIFKLAIPRSIPTIPHSTMHFEKDLQKQPANPLCLLMREKAYKSMRTHRHLQTLIRDRQKRSEFFLR